MKKPKDVVPLTKEIITNLESNNLLKSKVIFKKGFDNLYVFKPPFEISSVEENSFWLCPTKDNHFKWYVRKEIEKVGGMRGIEEVGDSWSIFSEMLVMLRLKDENENSYEIFNGTPIIGIEIDYDRSYLCDLSDEKKLKGNFRFGAECLLEQRSFGRFFEGEIEKLANFLIKDFITSEYKTKSDIVGGMADDFFFPRYNNIRSY